METVLVTVLALLLGEGLLAFILALLDRRDPLAAAPTPVAAASASASAAPAFKPRRSEVPARGDARISEADLRALLAYARAVLDFERAKAAAASGGAAALCAKEEAVLAIRRAHQEMERQFGRVGDPGVHWPIPVGAPAAELAQLEAQCRALLASTAPRPRSASGSAAHAVPLWVVWHAAEHRVSSGLDRATTGAGAALSHDAAEGVDPLAVYRRAFAGAATPAGAAPGSAAPTARGASECADGIPALPPDVQARLAFTRWLVQTGRLTVR